MNDLDDWLNSLGIELTPTTSETTVITPVQPTAVVQQAQEETHASSISPDDFNDILADNGFQEPIYEEAEEVADEEDEYDENGGEGRDLDAEEDEDCNNLIASGALAPISTVEAQLDENGHPFIEVNGERVYLSEGIIAQLEVSSASNQEILQAVQSVNDENYPEHNPDELLVQAFIVPAVHEQVSDSAVEAFNVVEETQPTSALEPLIPPNSPTLLLNDATSRFSGTEWYNEIQKQRIIIAGIGGIGSNCVYQLARMNPAALFMYDDDVVEQANMSGQLYCQEDVGKAKVDAMADMIKSYTTMRNVYAIKDKFTQNSEAGDIMICGFDNMVARKTFYNSWKSHVLSKPKEERGKCLFLDGRLSINVLQVFCLTGNSYYDWEEYEENYLFTDAEAEETQCSLKQTTYLACMIGSMIVNLFTNFVANTLNPIIPYDLPFFTEYDAQNMIFKTIK